MTGAPRQLVLITGAVAVLVGVIAALATGSWWLLLAAMAVHAVGTIVVVGYTLRAASQDEDKPDPVTQARREEEKGESTDEPPASPSGS
jgi:membrane protein implicated in regulation of membrane protease activity